MKCGDCVHWERAKPYKWGTCQYPLPVWIYDEPTILFPDNKADDCECFKRNDTSDRQHARKLSVNERIVNKGIICRAETST